LSDPVAQAFRKVITEIYWTDTLEEAEEILESYLDMIDEDLREVLLSRRRKICENPEHLIEIVRLEAAAELADNQEFSKLLLAKSIVESGFLFQCTPKWAELSNKEKARILAPLYKASYGLELALRDWPKKIDTFHLDHAFEMAAIALQRAEEMGILDQFKEYVDKMAEKLQES